MGKIIGILLVIIILVVGVYFGYNYLNEKESPNSKLISCRVGDKWNQNHATYGLITGEIKGVEKISLYNEGKVDLCCSDVTNQAGQKFKECSKEENSLITHSVFWKNENGKLLKIEETVPEGGAGCTYYFDSSGEFESRYCT